MAWLEADTPEKIAHDFHSRPLFRTFGQYAIMLDLDLSDAGAAPPTIH